MRGNVRQKAPGRWEIRIHIGRDPVTGRKTYLSRSVRGTRDDADRLCARLLLEHGDTTADSWTVTVAELLDRWLALAERDLSPATIRDYHYAVDAHLRPAWGTSPSAPSAPRTSTPCT